ncbi:MAG: M20 family metallopeptidase [Candidatus Latescibacteria bacterium]|nr:M20 family metallopeptidase [Candidatus Latescibacterota bacterium]
MPDPTSCTELLRAMVGFDTVNANISGVADAEMSLAVYLQELAQGSSLTVQRLPVTGEGFNLLVSHRVDEQAPWLLFESHLDTVTVEGMTVDPFAGEIRDGRLYGRGACDTKGTGAAMLWALREYAGATTEKANNVALVFTIDEEIYKTGVRTFVQQHLPMLPWRPSGVIVGEPTELKAVVAHNGVVRWSIAASGRAAHSSDPSKGRSAISAMTKVVQALEERYIPGLVAAHPLTGMAQCSINLIQGGVQINIVPEYCEVQIDRRLVPGEDANDVLPAVEEVLAALRRADPDLQVVQHTPAMIDLPLDPSGGEAFAGFVQRVLLEMGLEGELQGVGYGTDASSFGQAGFAAVVLGPGDIAQAHTADEWIDLAELQRGVEVYGTLMRTAVEG